jgi:hypothetical protein
MTTNKETLEYGPCATRGKVKMELYLLFSFFSYLSLLLLDSITSFDTSSAIINTKTWLRE